jgi:hypothetical protein
MKRLFRPDLLGRNSKFHLAKKQIIYSDEKLSDLFCN